MTFTDPSVALSQKMDDPVENPSDNGRVFSSVERANYLQKAYAAFFSFMRSILGDDEIVKVFPYFYKIDTLDKFDMNLWKPIIVYIDDVPLTYVDATTFMTNIAQKKKNFWTILDNDITAYTDGKIVDGEKKKKVKIMGEIMSPIPEELPTHEKRHIDIMVLIAAREAAEDVHNSDRFTMLTQEIKEWREEELLKTRKANG